MDRNLLPLFPQELVLYPDERLPLHIFEDRYKVLIRECIEGDRPFGVVLVRNDELAEVGCTASVVRVLREYDDGRMDIVVAGGRRFRLDHVVDDGPYLQGAVSLFPERRGAADPMMRERAITQHMKLLELGGRMPSPVIYQNRPRLSFLIANNAGLSLEQQQKVLEMPDEGRRIDYLVAHMEAFIPRVEEAEEVRRKVRSNGHFPDFPLGTGDATSDGDA
jgi:ATP-dependent Lon protease